MFISFRTLAIQYQTNSDNGRSQFVEEDLVNRILAGFAPGEFENSFFPFSVFWLKKHTRCIHVFWASDKNNSTSLDKRESINSGLRPYLCLRSVLFLLFRSTFQIPFAPKYTVTDLFLLWCHLFMYIKTERF